MNLLRDSAIYHQQAATKRRDKNPSNRDLMTYLPRPVKIAIDNSSNTIFSAYH